MSDINDNITQIYDTIKKRCDHTGTGNMTPSLIAVSKRQPMDRIKAALDTGHRVFGENRVQEAYDHWGEHRSAYSDLELHLIGSLQTNKAKEAVALFDCIQTIDRPKLARALKKECENQNRHPSFFIQVNTGDEPQKGGCALSELDELIGVCQELRLNVIGLMCIPPVEDDPALHFALLKKLAKRHGFENISMGMSGDYDLAAAMGATHIRVGTAIFGTRET
jgi:pyridoxal phosphate enzyme (YggS family)